MKIVIISHTEHYRTADGNIVGWGPTIREINEVAKHFDSVKHIAPLHDEAAPKSSVAYTEKNIEHVALRPTGGAGFMNKLKIVTTIPHNLKVIGQHIKDADWVQVRVPHNIGMYVLPYLSLRKKPNRWVKYAGNWGEQNAPLSYALQRWWLKKNFQHSKVTVNGVWPGDPKHVIPFENPCFTETELKEAQKIAAEKKFDGKLNLLFVGRMEFEKGAGVLMDAINAMANANEVFEEVVFAGDGKDFDALKMKTETVCIKCTLEGMVGRERLNELYAKAHLFVLPTVASEGFPKVLAEAAAHGAIPVVSDISSIAQYLKHNESAFILQTVSTESLVSELAKIVAHKELSKISRQATSTANLFTFENYVHRLQTQIFTND
jgi:glycosyltransferase involved in cell wall biosynthesis